jgi:CheY-like chemotaxis protein
MEFEFIGPDDKPAMMCLTSPDLIAITQGLLAELGYKVHHVTNEAEFTARYPQLPYQVVIIEECFGCDNPADNTTLKQIQWMPMGRRRQTTFILMGASFQTLNSMEAYGQSVHAVVNLVDLANLGQVIQKVTSETDLFLATFRDTQARMAQGKV